MPGLDPGIQWGVAQAGESAVDCRVKPGNDDKEEG
jgi:hypothetical protein